MIQRWGWFPRIAAELGDVYAQHVWRVLRAQKLDLVASKSWCESRDPDFVAKAADVVGLYMAPPENGGGDLCRREAVDPGPGAAQRPGAQRP